MTKRAVVYKGRGGWVSRIWDTEWDILPGKPDEIVYGTWKAAIADALWWVEMETN